MRPGPLEKEFGHAPCRRRPTNRDDVYAASKSTDIEAMRLRMAAHPSASATSTFLETREALRRYREAAPEHKTQARAVLDASLARLEIEVNQR